MLCNMNINQLTSYQALSEEQSKDDIKPSIKELNYFMIHSLFLSYKSMRILIPLHLAVIYISHWSVGTRSHYTQEA